MEINITTRQSIHDSSFHANEDAVGYNVRRWKSSKEDRNEETVGRIPTYVSRRKKAKTHWLYPVAKKLVSLETFFNSSTRHDILKISNSLTKALNAQIAMEANAVSSYLSAASWCEITGYDGAASFFYAQADEEHQHMLKFVHFLNGQGVGAVIPATKQPPKTFKSIESICKTALKNEQGVTKAINKMVDIAQKDKDHNTFTFLQFFVNEQIEEEQQFETILQKFNLLGRDKLAIYEIDKILATMAVSPTPTN